MIMKTRILFVFILFGSLLMAKDYRGAELRTYQTYRYGRFETRMKSAPNAGIVSSMFTYHELGPDGIQEWNEIDVEFLGRYTDRVQFNTITDGQVGHEYWHGLSYDPATEFHEYAFEWTPNDVAWFVDGVEVYRQTGGHITNLVRTQKIMMNIWPPAYVDWVGTLNPGQLPSYAFYDWFRYYAYVPGTGNTGTDNDFILLWEDNFDTWNSTRWQKASHTWDGNNSDFTPANAVFQDGYFILCLTTPTNTGYNGPALDVQPGTQEQLPEGIMVTPVYPNPFNGGLRTSILPSDSNPISIRVLDITGRQVYTEALIPQNQQRFTWQWNGLTSSGDALQSGTYLLHIQQGVHFQTQKMAFLK